MSRVNTHTSSTAPKTYEDQMLIDFDPLPRDNSAGKIMSDIFRYEVSEILDRTLFVNQQEH